MTRKRKQQGWRLAMTMTQSDGKIARFKVGSDYHHSVNRELKREEKTALCLDVQGA